MRTLLAGLLLLGGLGCTNVQPIGPMAKWQQKKGHLPAAGKADRDAAPEPVTVAAQRPTPPAVLITPGEVTADSSAADVQKLKNELEYDQKTALPPSKTVEVSRVKGGIVN
jgi:hypothetical protein